MGRTCAPPFSGLGHGPAPRTQRHCPPWAAHSLLKRRRPQPSPPERARHGQKSPVDTRAGSGQCRAMLGETQNQFSLTRATLSTCGRAQKQIPMCSLRSLTCLQVQVLPRQGMVGPSSHSRLWLGATPAGASSAVNGRQRGEGEANGPQGQGPARVNRGGPSWTEFVRLADQAVVAIAGAGMTNRAEPRACGHSREPRRLDPELGTKGTQAPRQTQPGTVAEGREATRLASSRTGENPPYGMIRGGGGNEGRI
jgi:hypothetical protein